MSASADSAAPGPGRPSFKDLRKAKEAKSVRMSGVATGPRALPPPSPAGGTERAMDVDQETKLPVVPSPAKQPTAAPRQAKQAALSPSPAARAVVMDVDAVPPTAPASPTSPIALTSPLSDRLLENADLLVKTTAKGGRSVFWEPRSGKSCSKGTTLLRLQPHISVLSSEHLTSRCYRCFALAGDASGTTSTASSGPSKPSLIKLSRCSGCRAVRYCSSACQRLDWPAHRPECPALKAFSTRMREAKQRAVNEASDDAQKRHAESINAPEEPGTSVRTMARMIWGRKRDPKWGEQLESMQSHRADLGDAEKAKLGQMSIRLAKFLTAAEEKGGSAAKATDLDASAVGEKLKGLGVPSPEALLDVCSRLSTNAFTASTHELDPVGLSISPTAALFNHSCSPNAVIVFPTGPGAKEPLHVVALADLCPGAEILTAYIDLAEPHDKRRAGLAERYLFDCACQLCTATAKARKKRGKGQKAWIDPREALWCEAGCGGWATRPGVTEEGKAESDASIKAALTCSKCGHVSTYDALTLKAQLQQAEALLAESEAMLSISSGAELRIWDSLKEAIPQLERIMPPGAYPLLPLLKTATVVLIRLSAEVEQESNEARLKRLAFHEDSIRIGMLVVAGVQAGSGSIYPYGHPSRGLALATLGKLLISDAFIDVAAASTSSQPSILAKPPGIPPLGPQRIMLGHQVLVQALQELRTGFGVKSDEMEGSVTHEVRETLRSLEAEAAMMGRARVG